MERERGGEDVLAPLCESCLLNAHQERRLEDVRGNGGQDRVGAPSLSFSLFAAPPFLRAGRKNLLDRAESGTIGWESSHGRRIFAG